MKNLLLSLAMLATPAVAQAEAFDVYGLWLTQARDAHIDVTDCGDGTPCGALAWVDANTTDIDRDVRNSDTSLRERRLIGVPIVWGYARGTKDWRGGRIYNPEDGKTFTSTMRLQENGTLKVQGCLGPICITNIWTPVASQPSPSDTPNPKKAN